MDRRAWLGQHALGLWFLGLAALGFTRWWMKVGREAAAAPDAMCWLAGSLAMALVGLIALRRRR